MHIKTILNRVTRYKSFVFGKVRWQDDSERLALEVEVSPRSNGRVICSGCGKARPGYDRAEEPRRFEFVPLWGILLYSVYHMRRVNCPQCGVKVERVPWASGKSSILASGPKLPSGNEVAKGGSGDAHNLGDGRLGDAFLG